jgi:hypothetical protein
MVTYKDVLTRVKQRNAFWKMEIKPDFFRVEEIYRNRGWIVQYEEALQHYVFQKPLDTGAQGAQKI